MNRLGLISMLQSLFVDTYNIIPRRRLLPSILAFLKLKCHRNSRFTSPIKDYVSEQRKREYTISTTCAKYSIIHSVSGRVYISHDFETFRKPRAKRTFTRDPALRHATISFSLCVFRVNLSHTLVKYIDPLTVIIKKKGFIACAHISMYVCMYLHYTSV